MRSKRLANKNNKFGSKIINHFNGEENENLLFMKNASIYVFIPENKFKNGNEPVWKKIGTGILKILKDKVDKKLRLVLRQKGVLNICANFRLDLTRYPLEINEFNQKQVFLTVAGMTQESRKSQKYCDFHLEYIGPWNEGQV